MSVEFLPQGGTLFDTDVTLALERSGGQAFFRVNVGLKDLSAITQASLACDVIDVAGGTILRTFGFSPTTQRLVITTESITDLDGFGSICTAVNCASGSDTGRKSSLANIRLYVIGK